MREQDRILAQWRHGAVDARARRRRRWELARALAEAVGWVAIWGSGAVLLLAIT